MIDLVNVEMSAFYFIIIILTKIRNDVKEDDRASL